MVGVKTWEDEQITLILTCKAQGKSVSEIIRLLKARWPRKVVKDSGVRYVMTNYKDFQEVPRTKSMAGSSKSRSSHAGRTSPQRRPNHKQAKPMSRRALPPPVVKYHTQTRIYSPPPDPLPAMDQNALASQMRQVSGGPITASLDIAQPFNVLNGPIHSRTKLLAHAEQAQNIGVYAIQRGEAVPHSSPGAKSIMASPTPPAPMMNPEAQAMMQGGFQENNMQRTASMPSNFQYNPHERMQPQNMQMYNQQGQIGPQGLHLNGQQGQMGQHLQINGQQWPHGAQNMQMNIPQQYQMGSMFNAQHVFPGTPSFGGHGAQYPGIAQNPLLQQGQPGGIGPYGDAATIDGLPGMPYNPSGYNIYTGLPQPATPHQMYQHAVNVFGPTGGMMAPSPAPMSQNNAAKIATTQNHGYHHHHQATPQLQRPASRISNIDPELRSGTPATGVQSINNSAIAKLSGSRPPTRNGIGAIPQQNHDISQQHLYGLANPSGPNTSGNSSNQGPGGGPSFDATHSSASRQPTVEQPQMGPMATLHANQSATQLMQSPQHGQAVKLQRDIISQGTIGEVLYVANSTPPASQSAHSKFEGHRNGSKIDNNSLNGPHGQAPAQVVKIILREPTFDTPFEFPASHRAWYEHITEKSKKMSSQPDKHLPPAKDLKFSVLSGLYQYVFWKPIFQAGVRFSDEAKWEAKSAPQATEALDTCPTSGSNCFLRDCHGCLSAASNATRTPTKEPGQKQLNADPKTPPPRSVTSSTTQVTPAVSSMNLKSGKDTPAAKICAQPELSQGGSNLMNMQNSSGVPSNNRSSGKRAASATEQGESPSKRHKGPAQTPSVKAPSPPFTRTREGFDGRMEFAPSTSLRKVFPSFTSKVDGRPVPNIQKLPLKDHKNRNSRNVSSASPFNPRPSQPLKSSTLFNSPGKRYSAGVTQMQQSMKEKLMKADLSRGSTPTKPAPIGQTPPQEPDVSLIQDGFPVPQQQQPAQYADVNANHQSQENQSPGLQNEDFAPPEQEQQGRDDGALFGGSENDGNMNQTLDNTDLDAILAGMDDTPPDSAPRGLSGDEAPAHDPTASVSPDSNPDPSPVTPASPHLENYYTGLSSPEQEFFEEAMYWDDGTYIHEPEKQSSIMNDFGKYL